LAESLDARLRTALEAVSQVAGEAGLPVYLVGGPVRDALLGAPVLDLDFSVVGDAVALAGRLSARTGGHITVHARFGTATVVVAETRIDLVTARRESYASPGHLPLVKMGSIAEDLARRDFSINAMALRLQPDGEGLIDPLGGLDDLDAGMVRALHPKSFADDPTRMLRAVRYEQRFGFRIDSRTLEDMSAAIAAGYMDAVSNDRWRHELDRILDETNPGPPLLRAAELGLLTGIHPCFRKVNATKDEGLGKLASPSVESTEKEDWLAALFSPLTASEAEEVIQRLRLSGRRAALGRDTIVIRESEARVRAASGRPSELSGMLDVLEPAAVSAWAKLTGDPVVSAALTRYAGELRYIRPRLSGEALLKMGVPQGPEVGEILARLRNARLDGDVTAEEDEMALARELLARSRFGSTS
jgi:tRNA nucleotidyltransferase (CCA-adding enzyme)